MWDSMRYLDLLLGLLGLCAGLMTAAGIFALLTSIGVMTRLAGFSHTASWVKEYEQAVLLGGTLGNLGYLYGKYRTQHGISGGFPGNLSWPFLLLYGLGAGIYVGALAVSLAELLNTSAVFCRRCRIRRGFAGMIVAVAAGKLLGSLLQFFLGWPQ